MQESSKQIIIIIIMFISISEISFGSSMLRTELEEKLTTNNQYTKLSSKKNIYVKLQNKMYEIPQKKLYAYSSSLAMAFQPVNKRSLMNGLSEWTAYSLTHSLAHSLDPSLRCKISVLKNSAD